MALLDLLGRRWALRVLWELQAQCGDISSSVLNDRLRELRDAGIVATSPGGGYQLTADGHSLLDTLAPLDAWAKRWAKRTTRHSPS
jgi:DNA-binding HxlR family transcriptional regulator